MNDLDWLLNWYKNQCDGDWEHGNGIKINTLDNPGWYLWVSINETTLQNMPFKKIKIKRSEEDWIFCNIEEGMFKGYGGIFNLPELLSIFRKWAEDSCA